jgi:hypothetical protein
LTSTDQTQSSGKLINTPDINTPEVSQLTQNFLSLLPSLRLSERDDLCRRLCLQSQWLLNKAVMLLFSDEFSAKKKVETKNG